jgi:hypothetical protein
LRLENAGLEEASGSLGVQLDGVNQELWRDYYGGEEAGGGVEHAESRLFADVGDVAEVPCDEVVDLVKRGEGDVEGVGDVFAVKDAAFDIALGEDDDFLGDIELFERADQVEIACAVRLADAFELTLDEERREYAIFRKLVLPPADRHVAAEGVAVVEIGADDGGFDVEAELHRSVNSE